jgi:hypothetical protein
MSSGRYAISCPPGCTEARVTIDSGEVSSPGGPKFTDGLVFVKDLDVRRATDTTGFLKLPPKK